MINREVKIQHTIQEQKRLLSWPFFSNNSIQAVTSLLREDEDSYYSYAKRFEEKWASFIGSKFCLSTNSGTAALHAALCGLDLPRGSEILVPTYTFWASIMPMRHFGLVPVFCDVSPETGNFDISDAKKKVTGKTRAALVVHLWGIPADMAQLDLFCSSHNLFLIEDACHAHGATWDDKKVGSLGDVSFFSFQSSKLLPMIEGGIMCTNTQDIFEKSLRAGHYLHINSLDNDHTLSYLKGACFGNKYRMHPLSATLGTSELSNLDSNLRSWQQANESFHDMLNNIPDIKIPRYPERANRTYYANCILYNQNKMTSEELRSELIRRGGLLGRVQYPLQHTLPIYQDTSLWDYMPKIEGEFLGAAKVKSSQISLPRFTQESLPLAREYADTIRDILR